MLVRRADTRKVWSTWGDDTAEMTVFDCKASVWRYGGLYPALPRKLSEGRAVVVDRNVYLVGGEYGARRRQCSALIYSWNGDQEKKWRRVGEMPQGCSSPTLALDGTGGIFIVGGLQGAGASCQVVRFDTQTGRVRTLPDMPVGRALAAAYVHDDHLFVLGGVHGNGSRIGTSLRLPLVDEADPAAWLCVPNDEDPRPHMSHDPMPLRLGAATGIFVCK